MAKLAKYKFKFIPMPLPSPGSKPSSLGWGALAFLVILCTVFNCTWGSRLSLSWVCIAGTRLIYCRQGNVNASDAQT